MRFLEWLALCILAVAVASVTGCVGEQASEPVPTTQAQEAAGQEETAKNTEPDKVSGQGSRSIRVELTPGVATYGYDYRDTGKAPGFFAVKILDGQGKMVDLVASHVGTTSGSKSVRIPRKGTYYVNVTADSGSWTLTGPPVN